MRTEKCMLAQAGDEKQIDQMIASGNWKFTWKYDGERGILKVGEEITLYNRSGKSINTQFPEIVEMASHLPFGVFDGEIYVSSNASNKDKPTTSGRTSVNEADAKLLARIKPATFMCFDVLEYEGRNVENEPYENRMEIISKISVKGFEPVIPIKNPKEIWTQMLSNGDEGMVAKRIGSKYAHCRSPDWIKLKTFVEDDFDVVGITSEKREVSALVLRGGLKVNCALDGASYTRLISSLVKEGTMMVCADGTLATRIKNKLTAKVKYLHKSETGLRFPILRDLEGF